MDIKIKSASVNLKDFDTTYRIVDLTDLSIFSPFYPHGNIPVPGKRDVFSQTVEGIWQGLKVFERNVSTERMFEATDIEDFEEMNEIFGKFKFKYNNTIIENDHHAKTLIYDTSYNWVLENKLKNECKTLKAFNKIILVVDNQTYFAELLKKHLLK